MTKKANSQKQRLKFYQKLVLNRYLLRIFGASKFEDIAQYLNNTIYEGMLSEGNTQYYQQYQHWFHDKMEISDNQLQQYDLNIVSHLNKINAKRIEKVKLKYFQYLSLLFVEYYLDMFFNHKDKLLDDLNDLLKTFQAQYPDAITIPPYQESDLNKIAFWNATGSGKTFLMHINYYQFRHYAGPIADGDSYILLTPKEGLSKQHLDEFADSDIPAVIFDKNMSHGFGYDLNTIQILENTKLASKDGEKTVAASRFGTHNVVFVDEGHRGASGDTWYKFRNILCENGFSFEYSATFGQAVAASNDADLESEYEKCIIFDYSYKYFYADGFGKDYNIINLQDDTNMDISFVYLVACLLTYYQQKRVFLDKRSELKPFNIENPLLVFVGSSVNAVRKARGKSTSDVIDILLFIKEFIKDKVKSIDAIKRVMDHTTGILDSMNRDVFRNCFPYLTEVEHNPESVFQDVIRIVFNCTSSSSILHVENMKAVPGEISLRLGENEPFGVINVGDDGELLKLCESNGFNTGDIDFKESLFESINKPGSKINLLIGSKKFSEGWNCFRVSTMGLMNVGKSEGSEIIQLFGRGIRLRGYNRSLMRSGEYSKTHPTERVHVPSFVPLMETLNVFGVKADYMRKFKEYLEQEGVPANKDAPFEIVMPIIRNKRAKAKTIYTLQIREGLDFKRDAAKLMLEYRPGIVIELDCYGKVQFETSRSRSSDEGMVKYKGKLTKNHLAFINISKLYYEMEHYKAEKLRSNMIITQEGILTLLNNQSWYELQIPYEDLRIRSFADYEKYERIMITLLKRYADKLYNVTRSIWENDYMEYKPIDDAYENYIEDDKYLISIDDSNENQELIAFIKSLTEEVKQAKRSRQLININSPQQKGNFAALAFKGSLYNPLLYVAKGTKEIVISPVALVESEKRFINDLDNYVAANKTQLEGKEIFLIRNKAKKGVGFFETAGFYPDFIMWVIEGDKQLITFIEPHGMVHENLTGEKVQLHKRIKEIQANLGNSNITLNSIIITESYCGDIIDSHPECEWNDNNVFFMSNPLYIEQLFLSIK